MVAGGNKQHIRYGIGDEVSYAFGSGMAYGEVVRVLEGGEAVEVQFEGGRREIKRARDRALRLLRRVSGVSELDERHARVQCVHLLDLRRQLVGERHEHRVRRHAHGGSRRHGEH